MLRRRLGLLLVSSLLLALLAFAAAALLLFSRQQRRQLDALLLRDLARVQALVERSVLGTPFVEDARGVELQFVTSDGRVRLNSGPAEPLPLSLEPLLLRNGERVLLTASLPWRLPTGSEIGTIRLALDISDAFAARRTLLRSLLFGGGAIALLALLLTLALLRRTLAPLAALAEQADAIDPAAPQLADYRGPDDEVSSLAQALNRAVNGIRERQLAERDALAEIAHELAGPLTVAAGQLEAVRRDRDDERLRAAHEATLELHRTSQDLLTLARGELGLEFDIRVQDLCEIAGEIGAEFPGVQLALPERAEILGDRERLRQALRNLVRNAVQASGTPSGVTLRVCTESAGSVRLEVHDRGPGLSEAEQRRIFERHYSRRGGAGLGLAVARTIVEGHGGLLEVRSALGEGSRFTIELPGLESQLEGGPETGKA